MLELSDEIVGVGEVGEMLPAVLAGLIVEVFDGGFLEDSVHALDLAIGSAVADWKSSVISNPKATESYGILLNCGFRSFYRVSLRRCPRAFGSMDNVIMPVIL